MIDRRLVPALGLLAALFACAPGPYGQSQSARRTGFSAKRAERGLQQLFRSRDVHGQPVGPGERITVTAVVVFASWCHYCRHEIDVLGELSRADPRLRVIGVNYYEKDDGTRLVTYLETQVPWLKVVRADIALFNALGRPSHVPSLYLFNGHGRLVRAYVPPRHKPPTMDELRVRIGQLLSDT